MRPKETPIHRVGVNDATPTLADLGVSKKESAAAL
jgi:hypothetical protein